MIEQFIIKNFMRKKALKVIYVGADKQVKTKWFIPKDNTITLNNESFMVVPEKIFIDKGISTMFVNYKNVEAIDMTNVDHHVFKPEDFKIVKEAKVIQKLVNATQKKDTLGLQMILLAGLIAAVIYLIYTQNQQFNELLDKFNKLRDAIGGGVVE
jgi:hypothetical protein